MSTAASGSMVDESRVSDSQLTNFASLTSGLLERTTQRQWEDLATAERLTTHDFWPTGDLCMSIVDAAPSVVQTPF